MQLCDDGGGGADADGDDEHADHGRDDSEGLLLGGVGRGVHRLRRGGDGPVQRVGILCEVRCRDQRGGAPARLLRLPEPACLVGAPERLLGGLGGRSVAEETEVEAGDPVPDEDQHAAELGQDQRQVVHVGVDVRLQPREQPRQPWQHLDTYGYSLSRMRSQPAHIGLQSLTPRVAAAPWRARQRASSPTPLGGTTLAAARRADPPRRRRRTRSGARWRAAR